MKSAKPESLSILGVTVHKVTQQESLSRIEELIHSGGSHLVVTLGTEMVMTAQRNSRFREIVNSASLAIPDGGGLVWASRRLKNPLPEKVAGIELLESICRVSEKKRWKIFLLGGEPGIAEAAAQNLRKRFPDVPLAGTHHGYFREEEILPILNSAQPQILFAGLGSPRQELWLHEHLASLKIPVGIGIGGSLDVFAGKLRRAPLWMRNFNLEWLYRFFQEPKRFQRILNIPFFMGKIYREVFRINSRKDF